MKLTKKDLAPILKVTYPGYKGRKFALEVNQTVFLQNYWDGDTRVYLGFVAFVDGQWKAAPAPAVTENPANTLAHQNVNLPPNVLAVENTIYQGKDLGIRVIAHPQCPYLPKFLPGTV